MTGTYRMVLLMAIALGSCGRRQQVEHAPLERDPTSGTAVSETLPLSPGVQIASHVSGGIAGFNDLVQVTDGWQLIVSTGTESSVRHLDGDEQMALREVLERFGELNQSDSNPGRGVPDSIATTLVARGWGRGVATAEDASAMAAVLRKLQETKKIEVEVEAP